MINNEKSRDLPYFAPSYENMLELWYFPILSIKNNSKNTNLKNQIYNRSSLYDRYRTDIDQVIKETYRTARQSKSIKRDGNGNKKNLWAEARRRKGKRQPKIYLGGICDAFELAVPVVLALDHVTPVELAALELHRDDVARRLVKQLHGDPQTPAHLKLTAFFYSSLLRA